ncbi:unnamed protein product [Angiostrongylus costaricensis]|uniref:Uncharacterized protein n=1 Tax=Angiostrongylus costaricensis TaxID=334426 RepID=A0A0R3PDA9_ANGCS|nr:unnamed protein product [Angiostrongylus costaricensis]
MIFAPQSMCYEMASNKQAPPCPSSMWQKSKWSCPMAARSSRNCQLAGDDLAEVVPTFNLQGLQVLA